MRCIDLVCFNAEESETDSEEEEKTDLELRERSKFEVVIFSWNLAGKTPGTMEDFSFL